MGGQYQQAVRSHKGPSGHPQHSQNTLKVILCCNPCCGTQELHASHQLTSSPSPPSHCRAVRYNLGAEVPGQTCPTNLPKDKLITKVFTALQEANVWYEDRPSFLDLEGDVGVDHLSPVIRAVRWHPSGDIWVTMDSEAGCNVLVESIGDWLPRLSEGLIYSHKAYPVLISDATVRVSSAQRPFLLNHDPHQGLDPFRCFGEIL